MVGLDIIELTLDFLNVYGATSYVASCEFGDFLVWFQVFGDTHLGEILILGYLYRINSFASDRKYKQVTSCSSIN